MRVMRKEVQEVETIADIICDRCESSCKDDATGLFEYAEIRADWGYCSSKDGEKYEGHLCESCFIGLLQEYL